MLRRLHSRITLDRDYRVLSADTETGLLEARLGENLWDIFPGSVGLWERPMRDAWDRESAQGMNFYDGTLWCAWFSVTNGVMTFDYEPVVHLDTTNLGTTRESLDEILRLVAAEEDRVAVVERQRRLASPQEAPEPQKSPHD